MNGLLDGIPQPDISESDSDFESICDDRTSRSPACNSDTLLKVVESISQPDLFSLSKSCNPDRTFLSTTSNGIEYDEDNPIYKTKTCTLYLGRRNDHYYALKTTSFARRLIHEWEIYKEIGRHPTIIEAYDFFKLQPSTNMLNLIFNKSLCTSKYFLQLDYAFGGSIQHSLNFFDSKDAWKVLAHISAALSHIHQKGYIHLDVSPSNILICYNKQLYDICYSDYINDVTYKLTDFGTVIKEGNFENFCEGAGPYASPESIQYPHSTYPVSYPTDIWSLGAVMFEIVTHTRMPRDSEKYCAIRKGEIDLSEIVPEEFKIVAQMLNPNPSLRPTADQIIQLPIVKEILDEMESKLDQSFNDEDISLNKSSMHNALIYVERKKNIQKILSDDELIIRRKSFDRI